MLPLDLQEWLFNEGYEWSSLESEPGGSVCQNIVCKNSSDESIFVKYMDLAPSDFFESEAEGLSYLSSISNVRTPHVYASGQNFLVLEYIESNHHATDFWEQLGYQLATIHSLTREESGFFNSNYCGLTPQDNSFTSDAYEFFANLRLMPLAERGCDAGLLNLHDLQAIESICLRLNNIVPEQPCSLLHGDLWSGNVHVSRTGQPVFIDPAVYFSWPEIDLAMTQLFGGFNQRFYDAYQEVRTLEIGWKKRLDLYNLYPLLNHLVLFGESYVPMVRKVIANYS